MRPRDMIGSLLLPILLLTGQASSQRPGRAPVMVGWSDELNHVTDWSPLRNGNDPKMSVPIKGALRLTMAPVPENWPYEYQWGGVARRAKVDIGNFPVLSARVSELLGGYAHVAVDVLDPKGQVKKSFSSTPLQAGGVTSLDLGAVLDPAIYNLQIRLIIGGSNKGCWGTYNWIRFTSANDAARLKEQPDQARIRKG